MKKTVALFSALLFVFSLAACGKDEPADTTAPDETLSETVTEALTELTTLADETETETTTAEATETVSETETEAAAAKLPVTTAEILAAYTAVVNKVKVDMPKFTSNDWQTVSNVDMSRVTYSLLSTAAGSFLESQEDSEPGIHDKGTHAKWFALPTSTAKVGCVLTDTSKITSAKAVKKGDNYVITISLATEKDPYMNIDNPTSCTSWHGRMFDVIDIGEVVEYAKKIPGVSTDNAYCTFQGTAILTYNPVTNECINLDHVIDVRIFLGSGAAKVMADYHFYDFKW